MDILHSYIYCKRTIYSSKITNHQNLKIHQRDLSRSDNLCNFSKNSTQKLIFQYNPLIPKHFIETLYHPLPASKTQKMLPFPTILSKTPKIPLQAPSNPEVKFPPKFRKIFSYPSFRILINTCETVTFAKGSTLYTQSSWSKAFFLTLTGEISLSVDNQEYFRPQLGD